MKSSKFIDLALEKENMTRYKLAQITGISDAALSRYKNGKRIMDNYSCFKIADILCIDTRKIIALANAEREKDEEKKEYWIGKTKEYGKVSKEMLDIIILILMALIGIPLLLKYIESVTTGISESIKKNHSAILDNLDNLVATYPIDFNIINDFVSNIQYILCKIAKTTNPTKKPIKPNATHSINHTFKFVC